MFVESAADKNSDLDMNKGRQTNGSNGNDKTAAPMSQISGVRRLQQSNSIVGIVPRFGVELTNEQPLAEVRSRSSLSYFRPMMHSPETSIVNQLHVSSAYVMQSWYWFCLVPDSGVD